MSQAGINLDNIPFGSENKRYYKSYTDQELDSDEFFWNQLLLIAHMKDREYLSSLMHAHSEYLTRMAGM